MPSPDRNEATLLHWEIIDVPLGGTAVPIVEYSVVRRSAEPGSPIVLFLAGGGSCGAQAAKLARLCAERSVSLVMFDLPGHTPPGLLGEATPARSLVKLAGPVAIGVKVTVCAVTFNVTPPLTGVPTVAIDKAEPLGSVSLARSCDARRVSGLPRVVTKPASLLATGGWLPTVPPELKTTSTQ